MLRFKSSESEKRKCRPWTQSRLFQVRRLQVASSHSSRHLSKSGILRKDENIMSYAFGAPIPSHIGGTETSTAICTLKVKMREFYRPRSRTSFRCSSEPRPGWRRNAPPIFLTPSRNSSVRLCEAPTRCPCATGASCTTPVHQQELLESDII